MQVKADYVQPKCYVRHREPKENDGSISGFKELQTADPVVYDLSLEDMNWLSSHHKYGENGDPRFRISQNLLERMLYLLELTCGKEDRIITVKEAEDIFVEKLKLYRPSAAERKHISPHNMHTSNAVSTVYKYWMDRRNKLQKPLLRKFWAPTSNENTNPHMVFRPREKERYRLRKNRRNDSDALIKSQHMLDNLEKAKRILAYVQKRELLKRHLLVIRREAFLQKLSAIIGTSENPRQSKYAELSEDLNFILSGKNNQEEGEGIVDAELEMDMDGSKGLQAPSRKPIGPRADAEGKSESKSGSTPQEPSSPTSGQGVKRSLPDEQDDSNVVRKQARTSRDPDTLSRLSWSTMSSSDNFSSHKTSMGKPQASCPYKSGADQIRSMRSTAGSLLRYVSKSGRHAVAAAVYGVGEFMSDMEAEEIVQSDAQKRNAPSTQDAGDASSRSKKPQKSQDGKNQVVPSNSSADASSIDSKNKVLIAAPGSEAGGLISPIKRPRVISSVSPKKPKSISLSFTRTDDDKIICDRLQDMPNFVPSYLLDVEHPQISPISREQLHNLSLPGLVGHESKTTGDFSDKHELSLIAMQQQLVNHHRPQAPPEHATYPPKRWAYYKSSMPNFSRAESRMGLKDRFLNHMAAVQRAGTSTFRKQTCSAWGTGSRGLWKRKSPPVRYFARGRIGRGNRIWMDRNVVLDLSRTEAGCDLDKGDAPALSSSYSMEESYNRLMDHELTYGHVRDNTAKMPAPNIPVHHSKPSCWSSKYAHTSDDERINPGSLAGGRKHIHAAPHPLDSGSTFFDVARSAEEQVPTMSMTLKHLNPNIYAACEEIAITQQITSAASSAAGIAKSEFTRFLQAHFVFLQKMFSS